MKAVPIKNGILHLTEEVEGDDVLEQIRTYGGFSVFWVTENQRRATQADRLVAEGVIVRKTDDPRDRYPWCVYEIVEDPDAG